MVRSAFFSLFVLIAGGANIAQAQTVRDVLGRWCTPDHARTVNVLRERILIWRRSGGAASEVIGCQSSLRPAPDGGLVYDGRCSFAEGPANGSIRLRTGRGNRLSARVEREGHQLLDLQLVRCPGR